MAEFIDPVFFSRNQPKTLVFNNWKPAFWLVFAKTGSINWGTDMVGFSPPPTQTFAQPSKQQRASPTQSTSGWPAQQDTFTSIILICDGTAVWDRHTVRLFLSFFGSSDPSSISTAWNMYVQIRNITISYESAVLSKVYSSIYLLLRVTNLEYEYWVSTEPPPPPSTPKIINSVTFARCMHLQYSYYPLFLLFNTVLWFFSWIVGAFRD